MVKDIDIKQIKNMNLCKVVCEELLLALTKYHAKVGVNFNAEGPAPLPLLYYLDTREHRRANRTNLVPRAAHLNIEDLNKIKNDDWNDETKTFGKLNVS